MALEPIYKGVFLFSGVGEVLEIGLPPEARIGNILTGFIFAPNRIASFEGAPFSEEEEYQGGSADFFYSMHTFSFYLTKTIYAAPLSVRAISIDDTGLGDALVNSRISVMLFVFSRAYTIAATAPSTITLSRSSFNYPRGSESTPPIGLIEPLAGPSLTSFIPSINNRLILVALGADYQVEGFGTQTPPDTNLSYDLATVLSNLEQVASLPAPKLQVFMSPFPSSGETLTLAISSVLTNFIPQPHFWATGGLFPLPKEWSAGDRVTVYVAPISVFYRDPASFGLQRLRFVQRDDWTARTGRAAANQPSSRQGSVRAGPHGTYS